jgi:hypothetical protein
MIPELIDGARRRYLRNQIVAQSANALSVALGGVVLLLLAGTQLLDWRLLAVVLLATGGIVLYRTVRGTPSAYRVAQVIDHRLKLADSLSTALHFGESQPLDAMRAAQLAQAEKIAREVDIAQALPLEMPRTLYAVAALGLLATGLFALRYGLERSLELRAPLARLLMDRMSGGGQDEIALRKKNSGNRPESPKPTGMTAAESEAKDAGQLDPATDSALDTVGVPDAVNDPLAKNESPSKSKGSAPGSEKMEGEAGDSASSESAEGNMGDPAASGQPGDKQGGQKSADGKQSAGSNSGENSSLMSKLKEAMSNVMSKMRQSQSPSGSQQSSSSGQNARNAKDGQKAQGQKGEANQGQQSGRESGDAQGQQSEGEGENGQSQQAKGGGQSSDPQSASQPGSGIGSQDGNKDVRLAEQQAAMGKISEIIGKRSANVVGEVTVEVQSSQQQLRTQYTKSSATHADAGGDLNRDEVPVVFQQFVQQYFDQVRKQPAAVTSQRGEPATRGKTPPAASTPPSM